ncbi:hypothetical protein ID866_6942 [Astraeus odoratus]|nr:hypothetical protein ID866_6942 [Astraeus odoratus]
MSLFTLSGELILLILDELDPVSLFQLCRASSVIHSMVGTTSALRYRYELALCGARDGPPNRYTLRDRLIPLLGYKRGWSTLSWSVEDRLAFTPPTIMGVAGNFFYQASQSPLNNGFTWSLHIYALRSFRTAPQSSLAYYQYNVPFEIRKVAIDVSQDLMIIAQLYFPPQQTSAIIAFLHLRNLRSGQEHRQATQPRLRYLTDWWGITPPGERVSIQQVQICGTVAALSIRLELEQGEGITELALFDWRLGGSPIRTFTGDALSFDVLSDNRITVVSQPDEDEDDSSNSSNNSYERRPDGLYVSERGKRPPQIGVYEIHPGSLHLRLRSYEFPKSWTSVSFLQQCPNSSSRETTLHSPGTLFYNDPQLRLIAIMVEFPVHARPAGCSRKVVVIVEESKLEPADDGEEVVRWEYWQKYCMVLNLPDHADAVQLVGRRLVFFENAKNAAGSVQEPGSRVHCLDLNPHMARYLRSLTHQNPPWRWQESWASVSTVFNHRGCRYVRTSTSDTYSLTWIDTTEDSLVLYDVRLRRLKDLDTDIGIQEREGQTRVRILTFGQEVRSLP